MCLHVKNGQFRIDPCLLKILKVINGPSYRSILSCCGHGKYPKTIIVYDKWTKDVFEFFSGYHFGKTIRKPKRYYKRDSEGYYYLPELVTKDQHNAIHHRE